MRVISEIFQALGKYSRRRIALKIDVTSAIPFMRSSLIALLPIRSCPAAFLGFRRLIDSIISAEVKGSIGGDIYVAITGEWSEERSAEELIWTYFGEIFLVMKKSSKSGILLVSVGQCVGSYVVK
uniref:uncharacterized protein LOC117162096 n=1 Tax=Bombus vancouverensis nearcticus TaxID=2705178 RepID=UPI00143C6F89|nr:uncharacterized protein LOC117162096 [Bombus vancouverensis nearcticus]XP_033204552.1 uncharacterized protein LOC117165201 [Bombus vancouverensis nearcticus]XP_033204555.1 uncharacterized protein LOC117165204 [Bombus vancouverensis nearcticus]XP_033204559.1 uncharacterized protein LOC117165209 [Bombus vancouverensis nearcticus]